MVTFGGESSTVIVVVWVLFSFPAASLAKKVSVHVPSVHPSAWGVVSAWKMFPVKREREMFVEPESPETLMSESFLFLSVTETFIWIVWVDFSIEGEVLEFATWGGVLSIVKVTCWVLFVFPRESFIIKRAVYSASVIEVFVYPQFPELFWRE